MLFDAGKEEEGLCFVETQKIENKANENFYILLNSLAAEY